LIRRGGARGRNLPGRSVAGIRPAHQGAVSKSNIRDADLAAEAAHLNQAQVLQASPPFSVDRQNAARGPNLPRAVFCPFLLRVRSLTFISGLRRLPTLPAQDTAKQLAVCFGTAVSEKGGGIHCGYFSLLPSRQTG
jgi:hypothetical protein